MSNEHIHQLVALITNAAKTIEDEFSKSSQPIIPTLDDVRPHPLDGAPREVIRKAIAVLDGACAQLSVTLSPPSHTIVNRTMDVTDAGCLRVAIENKIPDLLKGKPEGIATTELARAAGLDADKLERIMRRLATTHLFREVTEGVFANNRLSVNLVSDNNLSGLSMFFLDEIDKASSALNDTLTDPVFGPSTEPQHSAWNKLSGYPRTWFAHHQETPEGAKSAGRFVKCLSAYLPAVGRQGASKSEASYSIIPQILIESFLADYPWGDLPEGASVCDIGGSIGQFLALLHKEFPHLKLKLQDLPIILKQAEDTYWPKEAPEALEKQCIEFKAMDFTKEPPIPGCDVYYMSMILHDWSDENSVGILKHIKSVMKPDSCILISTDTS